MRSRWQVFVVVLAVLAVFPLMAAPALGQESEAKEGEHPSAEVDSPFKGWIDLTVWTIVVFLLLLFVLSKYAWKPMLEGLEKREHAIHGAKEEADRAKDEAQKLREQLQLEMNKAHEKVHDLLEQGRRDAEKLHAEMMAKGKADIQGERDRLQREMQRQHEQNLQDLWNQTAQLAALVSTKAIRRQLTEEDHRRFVDEALADLRNAGNNRHTGGPIV
jgi:F-type H+-transporting ATPase subunit b